MKSLILISLLFASCSVTAEKEDSGPSEIQRKYELCKSSNRVLTVALEECRADK